MAAERPTAAQIILFSLKKTNGRASFLEKGLGFQAAISVILIFFCHLSYMYIVVLSFLPQNTGVRGTNSSAYTTDFLIIQMCMST